MSAPAASHTVASTEQRAATVKVRCDSMLRLIAAVLSANEETRTYAGKLLAQELSELDGPLALLEREAEDDETVRLACSVYRRHYQGGLRRARTLQEDSAALLHALAATTVMANGVATSVLNAV